MPRRRQRGGRELYDRYDAVRIAAGLPPIGIPGGTNVTFTGFGKKKRSKQRGGLPYYRRYGRHGFPKDFRRDLYPTGAKPLGKAGLYAKWVPPNRARVAQFLSVGASVPAYVNYGGYQSVI